MNPTDRLSTVLNQFRRVLQEHLTRIDTDLAAGHITEARARLKHLLDMTEDWRIHAEIQAQLDEDLT